MINAVVYFIIKGDGLLLAEECGLELGFFHFGVEEYVAAGETGVVYLNGNYIVSLL